MNARMTTAMVMAMVAMFAAGTARAAVVQLGDYRLGEAGSVSTAAGKFVPLVDSIGTANNVTAFQGTATTALVTTGLAAPGSTAAIAKTQLITVHGWHGNASPYALSNDWAFQIWVRPDSNGGTILLQTDNSVNGVSVWAQNGADGNGADIAFAHGNGGTANPTSGNLFDYVVGTWYKIDIIRYNGVNRYYINDTFLASDALSGLLSAPMLGFAAGGLNGTAAAYDEMKVWSFNSATDSLLSVEIATGIVQVPAPAALPAGLAMLAAAGLRRRRR